MAEQASSLASLSSQLEDAVAAASTWTIRVHARRGPAASGVVLASDLVLTADHVVDPSFEDRLRVGLPDGSEATAELAGRDPASDLAVLRLAGASLTPASAADAEPRVGALALVVARPERNVQASLALISGTGGPARTRRGGVLERFLLVDTVMYPGFSGGPLVNASSRVVGLNTSGLASGGASIAIPWSVAARIGQTLAQFGRIQRGFLGIGSQPVALTGATRDLVQGQERGLLVVHVAEGGPAAAAGFLQGDILVRLADDPIGSPDDLQAALAPERVGQAVTARVIRGGELRDLSVTVGTRD